MRDGEAQRAAFDARLELKIFGRFTQVGESRGNALQLDSSGFCQVEAARCPIEQAYIKTGFQFLDRLGQCGRCDPDGVGGIGQTAMLSYLFKGSQIGEYFGLHGFYF